MNHEQRIRQKKWKKLAAFLGVAFFVLLLLLSLFQGFQLGHTNQYLRTNLEEVQKQLQSYQEAEQDNSYDYLAIGNSITQHPVSDIWWGEWGMGASREENDYFHIVKTNLESSYEETTCTALNFTIWEDPYYERNDTFKYLEKYLSERLDLITIQLGENIRLEDNETNAEQLAELTEDYKDLIQFVQQKAPNAQILMIGQYWASEVKDAAKQAACTECNVKFIDLSEIQGNAYIAGVGTMVEGADGQLHEIKNEVVAAHPGDAAMAYIANGILQARETTGTELVDTESENDVSAENEQ